MDTETFYRLIHDKEVPLYRYYGLVFHDGIPMKAHGGNLVFHPIFPAFSILELCRLYEETKCMEYVNYAYDVWLRSNRYLEDFHGSLVLMYKPSSRLCNIGYSFFSALTQAQYLYAGYRIYLVLERAEMLPICEKIYSSMKIPQKNGGVLLEFDFGNIVEVYHSNPPLFTLNGFLIALERLFQMRDFLRRFDREIDGFLRGLTDGLKHILHLYDCSYISNSRYNLSGFRRIRFVFEKQGSPNENFPKIEGFYLIIPSLGTYDGHLEKRSYRFENYMERNEGRILQFNIVMSMFSYPERNVFTIRGTAERDFPYDVYLSEGDYDPLLTGMPTSRWKKIQTGIWKKGSTGIEIPIPFDDMNLFAYPTNFKKAIGGLNYNFYHFIHISYLNALYKITGEQLFLEYAIKFHEYSDAWISMDAYKEKDIMLSYYGSSILRV